MIVPVGRSAIRVFLPDVTTVAQAHRIPRTVVIEGYGEVVVFPTYHPAASLHNPFLRKAVQDDFRALGSLLRGELESVELGPPPKEGYYETRDTSWLAEYLKRAGTFSLDTESDQWGFWGLSVSTKEGEGIVVRRGADLEPLKHLMGDNPDLLLVGQNLYYDLQVLAGIGIEPKCRLWDTMIAAYLLGEESQGLKEMAYQR